MRIENNKFNLVEFQELEAREIFMHYNEYFIKRNVENGIKVDINKSLALSLNTGIETYFSPTEKVIKLNGKLVIE